MVDEGFPPPCSVYKDDSSIADDVLLVRAISPLWVVWEETCRLKSEAFQDYPERRLHVVDVPAVAMSVALLVVLEEHDRPIEAALMRFSEDYGLATLTAGEARECGQGIVRWPTAEEPWHAMVFCLEGQKRTKRQRKCLSQRANLVKEPAREPPG